MEFLGVTILQGVEFSIFLIDFEWALQQCSATALPVIVSHKAKGNVSEFNNIDIITACRRYVNHTITGGGGSVIVLQGVIK